MATSSLNEFTAFNLDTSSPVSRKFKRLQHLEPSSQHLWLIQSGIVKTYCVHEDGYYVTLGYWGKGDVVGGPLHNHTCGEMLCVSPVSAQAISIQVSPELISVLMSQMSRTQSLLAIQGIKSMQERLKSCLFWLAKHFGRESKQGCSIHIPLTHEAIAELMGCTRVTITILLKKLTERGILIRSKKVYTLTPQAMNSSHWFDSQ